MKDRVSGAVDTARPYVERMAQDDQLHEHVKKAYVTLEEGNTIDVTTGL